MKKIGLLLFSIGLTSLLLSSCSNYNMRKDNNSSISTKTSNEEENIMYKKIQGIDDTYLIMNPDPVFGSTATIIEKNGKGLLVDTQFSKKDADKIVQLVKSNNIDIETIYISYSDPDYYFGTNQIKKSFPKANVVATASTISRIKDTYKSKLSVWADTLKENAPDKIIIPNEIKESINLEDVEFEIFGNDIKKQTLYNKNDQLLVGGILVSTGSHLFMADTKSIDSQLQWINDLSELESLSLRTVIPGHFEAGNQFMPQNIKFTKEYIEKFITAEKESKVSSEIITKMKNYYPKLPEGNLEMSAKVVTGEMDWE